MVPRESSTRHQLPVARFNDLATLSLVASLRKATRNADVEFGDASVGADASLTFANNLRRIAN